MIEDAADRLAALYDWHNAHRLQRQTADNNFWRQSLRTGRRILVMGAGTGRVAAPLADSERLVLALDLDWARLRRVPRRPGLTAVCADYFAPPIVPFFDHVIFPYSALQLAPITRIEEALRASSGALASGGSLWIDASESFRTRSDHPWREILSAACPELGATVSEWQCARSAGDHLQLKIRFEAGGKIIAETTEHWHFHDEGAYSRAFRDAGLVLRDRVRGYGGGEQSPHRLIYRLERAGSAVWVSSSTSVATSSSPSKLDTNSDGRGCGEADSARTAAR